MPETGRSEDIRRKPGVRDADGRMPYEGEAMGKYDDIINMPHHVSAGRAHLSLHDRAAQFAPFAALTGFGDAIGEAERLTDRKIEITEDAAEELDKRISVITQCGYKPEILIKYFKQDERKEGGAYVTAYGRFAGIDKRRRILALEEGTSIPLDDIIGIESEVLSPEGNE